MIPQSNWRLKPFTFSSSFCNTSLPGVLVSSICTILLLSRKIYKSKAPRHPFSWIKPKTLGDASGVVLCAISGKELVIDKTRPKRIVEINFFT